ncbi:MAG: tRNA uridine-5-carboxymethylaminomethyl(34) synthesis enzyme MnmG [candidate division Zixibacteria bacterium]|nr:tRNA uridine-5-carboxymethylaminomethyl(34) synthesis enzyme MnmG [candidate division Zixibacteria bacterium]
MTEPDFDIIVVGGGHAGTEAVRAASRLGMKVALVTMDKNKLALMSCNPAVGGVGKGHLVREVDALGGIIGVATDYAGIQFRRLNLSKGPAVRSTRVQCDRREYSRFVSQFVARLSGVEIIEDEATGLVIENNRVKGIKSRNNNDITAKAVILATGTFLNGLMHIGDRKFSGGRRDDPAAVGLTESLQVAGFETGRLKTGTPPRIDGRTIDYSKVEAQPGHEPPPCFSHFHATSPRLNNAGLCYLTYTTPETARIIRENLDRVPLYSGQIKGRGPRYCPSIEDKVVRFADKQRHQLFIEPEGNGTEEIYLNGFSTSIPEDIQAAAVRTVIGLENAVITKPGYAIEYDYVPPFQIKPSLETRRVAGLFHAGQINGTSGYEEAAAQGLIAGINATLYIEGREPFVLGRDESYIGVMLDDIVTRNISEPYRMFTSRAEFRLALREDNALDRLVPYGRKYNLYSDDELALIARREKELEETVGYLKSTKVSAGILKEQFGLETKKGSMTISELMCRPEVELEKILSWSGDGFRDRIEVFEKAYILLKYKGYLKKQEREIERRRRLEGIAIPSDFDYSSLTGLKKEATEKLNRFRPFTVGQAGRIEGVTPSDMAVLTIYISGRQKRPSKGVSREAE